jgi:hypothetical protein
MLELPQEKINFFVITRMVSAWAPVQTATATPEVGHSDVALMPLRPIGKRLRVVTA